jgi:hypothetical protein
MALGRKPKLFLLGLSVVGLVAGWQYLSWWMKVGYSIGTRTGIVRKISVKGPPYCKYLAGEMALQGSFGQPAEIWEFSIEDHRDENPLVKELHEAEKDGKRITLKYRQDAKIWWRCNPAEYYITAVEH